MPCALWNNLAEHRAKKAGQPLLLTHLNHDLAKTPKYHITEYVSVRRGHRYDCVFDRSLRSLLDGEMEHSAVLRQETDVLKKKLAELEERHTARIQALSR